MLYNKNLKWSSYFEKIELENFWRKYCFAGLFFTKFNRIWTSWESFETFWVFVVSIRIIHNYRHTIDKIPCRFLLQFTKMDFQSCNHLFACFWNSEDYERLQIHCNRGNTSKQGKLIIWVIRSYGNGVMGNGVMGNHLIIWICIEKFEPLIRTNESVEENWTQRL